MSERYYLTDQVRQFLIATHTTHTAVEQAQALAWPYDAICYQRMRLIRAGVLAREQRAWCPPFTETENDRIRDLAQQGYSVARIGRALGRSVNALYTHITTNLGGLATLRGDELARVWSTTEVGRLFGVTKHTVNKWIGRGWLSATANRVTRRRGPVPALITDEALLQFLELRTAWPAWHPADMTDPDWQAVARDVRRRAGGEWITLADLARRSGRPYHSAAAAWRRGVFAGLTTLIYGREHFVWSADLDRAMVKLIAWSKPNRGPKMRGMESREERTT